MHSSHGLCRLCAKSFEVSSLLHISHDSYPSSESLDVLIRRYLHFSVSVSDSLSNHVCKLCCAHVFRWHKFFTMCLKAQAQLESSSNTAKRRRSNYCIARWCNNSNDKGIPFFRVPKDRNRAIQWLSAADRMDLIDKDVAYLYRCYLCATHFSKEMFVNENGKSLNRNAVPLIFSKPAYAIKIEEALSSSEKYPKKLQGVRLKNILPKSEPKTEEISTQEPLSVPRTQESYPQIIRVVCGDSHEKLEKPLQEALFVTDSVSSHCNIDIINMSPVKEQSSERIKTTEVEDSKGINIDQSQVLNEASHMKKNHLCEPVSSSSVSEVLKNSFKKNQPETAPHGDIPHMCDIINSATNHKITKEIGTVNQFNCRVNVTRRNSVAALPNTLMDFCSDDSNVTMLDLNQKRTDITAEGSVVLQNNIEDQDIGIDPLALPEITSEDSIPLAPSFSLNPTFLNHGLNFPSKDLASKHCLENMVVSQDFLLMHSSNDHIGQVRDHGFRQDENLNNLCGAVIREPVPETSVAYGERSMMAEASVRTIECTSPSHGQIIEGLMDLDQFLDSGYVANHEKPM